MNSEIKQFQVANDQLKLTVTTSLCTDEEVQAVIAKLDTQRGVMLTSRYEFPGRYTKYDIGFSNPPISIEAIDNKLYVEALNERGQVILPIFLQIISVYDQCKVTEQKDTKFVCEIYPIEGNFLEEDRSKMPHVMNVVRHLVKSFSCSESHLGFYGIFGYDLGLDFMGVKRIHERHDTRDLVLYFVDELFITDHEENISTHITVEFETTSASTVGKQRSGIEESYIPNDVEASRDMQKGEYAKLVDVAKESFACGDLFEVVPSQVFSEPCSASPSQVFNQLLHVNPAPYGALINLGKGEWTISASPEMFVRVDNTRVETCPIAGTIARGSGDVTDEQQIQKLLESEKDLAELTMCTDVDRNDKSRVCLPETIDVIGRRQIEIYSRLIHTVDHVEGHLAPGYDAIDAFLTHMWAVTITGAPKMWAMKFIEKHEKSPRRFYGGSMGYVGLDGSMNTGLMLRSIHVHSGQMHIRVGATLLFDSDADAEEQETELKASAMLDVVRSANK